MPSAWRAQACRRLRFSQLTADVASSPRRPRTAAASSGLLRRVENFQLGLYRAPLHGPDVDNPHSDLLTVDEHGERFVGVHNPARKPLDGMHDTGRYSERTFEGKGIF